MRRARGSDLLAVAAVGLFVAWFFLLRPGDLGGTASYVRVAGIRMEPTLADGDLAIVRAEDSYQRGDVVAFRVPEGEPGEGNIVIHRIVGGSVAGFVTQGDNKSGPDLWKPTAHDIVGALWFTVPGGGRFLERLQDPVMFGALAAALTVFSILIGGGGTRRRRTVAWVRTPRARAVEAVGEVCREIEGRLTQLEGSRAPAMRVPPRSHRVVWSPRPRIRRRVHALGGRRSAAWRSGP